MTVLQNVAFVGLAMIGTAHAALSELTGVVDIQAGGVHACALTGAGAVECWGNGGQLGDGTTQSRSSAGYVAGLTSGIKAIGVSRGYGGGVYGIAQAHSCAVTLAGGVKCWGSNFNGQLGDGTTTQRLTPVDVIGLSGPAVAVAAGLDHTCALLSDGGVQCWGRNDFGQLGDGTTTDRLTATAVVLATGNLDLSASGKHTCAVTAAQGVKCWGSNERGQLGDGTTTTRLLPVDVLSLSSGVAKVVAGGPFHFGPDYETHGQYTCALTASGGLKCWGANSSGQLGDGTFTDRYTPFDVVGLASGVSGVFAGGYEYKMAGFTSASYVSIATTCAVTSAGAPKCWGIDVCGSLGNPNYYSCPYPFSSQNRATTPVDVMVGLPGPVSEMAVGGYFTCALVSGAVWCWPNSNGQAAAILAGTLPQTISIGATPNGMAVGSSAPLQATASSSLPVSFTSLSTGICTVSSSTVTGVAQGKCVIAADQAGNENYDPAPQVVFDFRVGDKLLQTITFGPAPSVVVNGVGQLSATASSGLPVSFTANTPSVCTVSGSIVTGIAAGSCTVTASQAGDNYYAAAPQQTQTFPVGANNGSFGLTVSRTGNGSGTVTSSPAGIDCGLTCAANFTAGTVVSLTPTPSAGSVFVSWSGACSGSGPCNVTLDALKGVTASFAIPSTIPRLAALSTRGEVLTGDNVMIAGFIIGGSTSKTVIVRARGPSLTAAGISNALANPTLQLVRSSDQTLIATNDDWGSAANAAQVQSSGFAPTDPLESAILMTLPPGAYTAIMSGVGGGTGVGIVEVYALDHAEVPLVGISTRADVGNDNEIMIAGLIVQGATLQVIVRARGPSLGDGRVIANPLPDPVLNLVRSSDGTIIATNDDWQSASNAAQIQASGFAPSNSLESAILINLDPGSYTVLMSGKNGGTGIGILEVFTP